MANNKYLFYVLGGPGVGKSTIMRFIQEGATTSISGTPEFEFLLNKISLLSFEAITLDTIKNKMATETPAETSHPHPEKQKDRINEYKTVRDTDFHSAFAKASNIYLDDHGDLSSQDEEFLRTARAAGYNIVLINAAMKPEDYMKRQYELGSKHQYNPQEHLSWAIKFFKTAEKAFGGLMPLADYAFTLERTGNESFVAHNAKKTTDQKEAEIVSGTSWKNITLQKLKKIGQKYKP